MDAGEICELLYGIGCIFGFIYVWWDARMRGKSGCMAPFLAVLLCAVWPVSLVVLRLMPPQRGQTGGDPWHT